MTRKLHPLAGILALLIISSFWLSTVGSTLFGSAEAQLAVKRAIPWGFILLIPAMILAGATGRAIAGRRRGGLIGQKQRLMALVAVNGIVGLVPAALFLAWRAGQGDMDGWFHAVQALELLLGAVNIALLITLARLGRRMTAPRRRNRLDRAAHIR